MIKDVVTIVLACLVKQGQAGRMAGSCDLHHLSIIPLILTGWWGASKFTPPPPPPLTSEGKMIMEE